MLKCDKVSVRYNVKIKLANPEFYDGKEFYNFNGISQSFLNLLEESQSVGAYAFTEFCCVEECK